ncbi:hypothetical protein QBC37DRAFT_409447 [Rhypophila decipiens]|uniref:Uncharacterized protein n=1 Tax=Rhypophila decipiens TaxID=261697 RepID=A0AAN6YKV5_9PEZI|nr:hypothetical protein QBC37DRAFT_409447 [Rhypophila decipiens]
MRRWTRDSLVRGWVYIEEYVCNVGGSGSLFFFSWYRYYSTQRFAIWGNSRKAAVIGLVVGLVGAGGNLHLECIIFSCQFLFFALPFSLVLTTDYPAGL